MKGGKGKGMMGDRTLRPMPYIAGRAGSPPKSMPLSAA